VAEFYKTIKHKPFWLQKTDLIPFIQMLHATSPIRNCPRPPYLVDKTHASTYVFAIILSVVLRKMNL